VRDAGGLPVGVRGEAEKQERGAGARDAVIISCQSLARFRLAFNSGEVIMKTLVVAAIAVAFSATSASAQSVTTTFSSPNTAFGADPVMRVTSTFRTTVAVTEPQANPDAKAQETARRALYGMAESECTALSEIFKAECRLSNVSISIPIVVGNVASNTSFASAPSNSMSATAIYELKPRGVASGR
jgi:hypothetical protein